MCYHDNLQLQLVTDAIMYFNIMIDRIEEDPICYLSPFVRNHIKRAIETVALINLVMFTLTPDNWRLHTMLIAANLCDHGRIALLPSHEVPAFVEEKFIHCIGFEIQQILK